MRKVQHRPRVTIAHHFKAFAAANTTTPAAIADAGGGSRKHPSAIIAAKAAG
jgi:hypothetical protein